MANNSMEALVKHSWVLVVSLEVLVPVSPGQDLAMPARPRLLTSTKRTMALVSAGVVEDRSKADLDKVNPKVRVPDKEIKAVLKPKDTTGRIASAEEESVVQELVVASVDRSKITITSKEDPKVTLGTLKAGMMAASIPTRGNRDTGNEFRAWGNRLRVSLIS